MPYTPTITPTDHDRAEWSRLAQDAYRSERNPMGHKFSAAAAWRAGVPMPIGIYDDLQGIYRAWLIGGWLAVDAELAGPRYIRDASPDGPTDVDRITEYGVSTAVAVAIATATVQCLLTERIAE